MNGEKIDNPNSERWDGMGWGWGRTRFGMDQGVEGEGKPKGGRDFFLGKILCMMHL